MARMLDSPDGALSARVAAARTLVDVMGSLRGAVPDEDRADRLDELALRRAARVAAGG